MSPTRLGDHLTDLGYKMFFQLGTITRFAFPKKTSEAYNWFSSNTNKTYISNIYLWGLLNQCEKDICASQMFPSYTLK